MQQPSSQTDKGPTARVHADSHALPDGWARDPYWHAAVHVLEQFGDDARIWAHVNAAGINYAAILGEGTWSSGEMRVLQAAASLWNGAPVALLDLVGGLDDGYWWLLIEALHIQRDG